VIGPPYTNLGDMYWILQIDFHVAGGAVFSQGSSHMFYADTDRWVPGSPTPDCGDGECAGLMSADLIGFAAVEGSGGVTVQWTCQSDNAGFNIYRSVGSSGNYELLNGGLLKSESYVDTDVEAGLTYYYQLGVVDLNAKEELSGPVSIAVSRVSWGTLKSIYR
jgi:hypothetical protein